MRVAVCLLLVTALLYLTMAGLLATLSSAGIVELFVRVVIAGALFAALLALAVRCFLSGVWVTDHGIRVLRPLSTRAWQWADIADVRSAVGPTRLAGSVVRVHGETVLLVLTDGSDVETPVASRSLDFLGRPEAYDMASGAVEGWLEQYRRRSRPGR